MRRHVSIGAATVLALVGAIAAVPRPSASAPPRAERAAPALSTEQETAIGWLAAAPVAQRYGGSLAADDPLQRRVAAIGAKLAATDAARATPWRFGFHVLASSDALAFALPGGEVFVSHGMIDAVGGSDDAIAAVLAHQMGHVLARHAAARLASRPAAHALVASLASPSLDERAAAVAAMALVDDAPLDADAESEADALAVRLLHGAGLKAAAAIAVIHAPSSPIQFHGPRGDPAAREQRLAGLVRQLR